MGSDGFGARLDAYIEWCVDGGLKAFDEGGRKVNDTIARRRRRLACTAQAVQDIAARSLFQMAKPGAV